MTTWTVGDLEPPLAGTCLNGDQPVDLSTATVVEVHVKRPDGTVISRPVTSTVAPGDWIFFLQEGDLNMPGAYRLEVQVTWPGGRPQTFTNGNGAPAFTVRSQIA